MVFDYLREMYYEGRYFRLSECQPLERSFEECQRNFDNARKAFEEERNRKSRSVGTFRWNPLRRAKEGRAIDLSSTSDVPGPSNCNKKAHEAYACRAMALGCGGKLSILRQCAANGAPGECKAEQLALSSCVNVATSEFEIAVEEIMKKKRRDHESE